MNWEKHYLSKRSAQEIMKAANADMALARVINPVWEKYIRKAAEDAINELKAKEERHD